MDSKELLLYELNLLTGKTVAELNEYSVTSNITLSDIKDFYLTTKAIPMKELADDIKKVGAINSGRHHIKKLRWQGRFRI